MDDDVMEPLATQQHAAYEVTLRLGQPVRFEFELQLAPGAINFVTVGCQPPPDPYDRLARAEAIAASADAVVLIVGTNDDVEREGVDRANLHLPGDQALLIERVLAANPNTVVVLNAAAPVEMPWSRSASTVLYTGFPGQGFARALVEVLTGAREPGGRLPITIARHPDDYPAYDTRPDPAGQLVYQESVFVGYRHLDAQGIEPAFCFGHGLGYSHFEYEDLQLSVTQLTIDDVLGVTVTLRNAGQRRSKEVVQVYVSPPETNVPRPPRELKGFLPVMLDSGEERSVRVELAPRSFAHWDSSQRAWTIPEGSFHIEVGRSSRDIRLTRPLASAMPHVLSGQAALLKTGATMADR